MLIVWTVPVKLFLGVFYIKLRLKLRLKAGTLLVAGLWSLSSTFLADNLALDKKSGIDLTH